CREIQRSIRESVKYLLDRKIGQLGLRSRFFSTMTEITSTTGSQILFEGLRSNVTSLQSLEAIDIAWIEEAQSVSQNSLDILYPTLRAEGSEIWASWNPRNATDPVDRLFRTPVGGYDNLAIPKGYKAWMISRKVTQEDNPFFPPILA